MPATAERPTPPAPPPIIPDAEAVHLRLRHVCREARLLRRLLALSRQAGETAPESVSPVAGGQR